MEDLARIGGTPAIMKYLLEKGLLNGDCITVTGKSIRDNLKDVPSLSPGQDIIKTLESPIKSSGHIQILYGNVAPAGKEGLYFSGTAKVYDSEEDMLESLKQNEIVKGDVVVIRYEGPKGGMCLVLIIPFRSWNARNAHSYKCYNGRRTGK
jgi:dihydroxy-acid dehydratase